MVKENLLVGSHKISTKESRKNHTLTFGRRCEYHGGRPGVFLMNGIWLCDSCVEQIGWSATSNSKWRA